MGTPKTSAILLYLHQRGFRELTEKQLGEPFAGYDDFDACLSANNDKDDPAAYCATIKRQAEASRLARETVRGFQKNVKIFESLEAVESHAFSWFPNIAKLKELSKGKTGKFLLVEGLHPMTTDPFSVGHGARKWTREQVMKSTYTAIGKGLNINHEITLNPRYAHYIAEGEFNEATDTAEYIVYEEDPEILELIRKGYIGKVSMQGYPRRETTVCDACGTSGCSCQQRPEGVLFGERDGVAMAYVITKPGARYMGILLQDHRPGDWNSSIQLVESMGANNTLNDNSQLNVRMSTSPVTRESLAKQVKNAQLKEVILNAEKHLVKEDLNMFNDALASGDAITALRILADAVYAKDGGTMGHTEEKPKPPGTAGQQEKGDDEATAEASKPKPPAQAEETEIQKLTKTVDAQAKEITTLKDSFKNLSVRYEETIGTVTTKLAEIEKKAPAKQIRETAGLPIEPVQATAESTEETIKRARDRADAVMNFERRSA